jgi:fibronectin-binding autotransporter adhesin
MLATTSSSSKIYYWDPQGQQFAANPYTGSMTGTWENNDWSYGSSPAMASPVGWTDGKAVCFGVNTGTGTPAYTVTVNSSHVVAGFFDGGLSPGGCDVTITGSGIIDLASGPQALDALNHSGGNAYLRINCVIAGNGVLYPEGNGQSYLHGANTFTGGTTLGYPGVPFSGTVNFNNDSAFGVGTLTLSSDGNGGALVLEGSSAVTVTNAVTVASTTTNNIVGNAAGLTFSGNWTLGGNLLTLGAGGTAGNQTIISGAVSGTAGLTLYNSGTVVLSGVNTYSGTTSINSPAVLTIGGAGQLGSGSYGSSIVNGGTFNYNSTANQTLSGVISGTGKLSAGGSGTLTLSAANTYTGTTTINSGATLQLGVANGVNSASSVYLANGGTFDLNSKSDSIATLSSPVGGTLPAGNVINNNGTLTLNGASVLNSGDSGSSAYSGVISGSGNLVISGGGSHTLSGANTYSGATTVSGGTLVPGYNGALPSGSALTDNSPGIFDLASVNETIPSLAGSGTVNLGSGNLTVGGSASTTFSGVLQGAPGEVYAANSTSQPGLWGYYYATPSTRGSRAPRSCGWMPRSISAI